MEENKLKAVSHLVKHILEESFQARNSDNYLYFRLLEIYGKRNGFDINQMPITTFLLNMKDLGVPGFETVRRSRQKVQHDFPELAGCSDVEAQRAVNQEVYKEFAVRCAE